MTRKPNLSAVERHILTRLGGRRWTTKRYTPEAVAAARAEWKAVRAAIGFTTPGGWMTTDKTSPKLYKNELPSLGLTIHSAKNALVAWRSLDATTQQNLATAVRATVHDITHVLAGTVCPMSTEGCRCGCVTAESAKAKMDRSQRARLARHLFLVFQPAHAFALTAAELDKARQTYGRRGARWRVNVSDDLRIERLAPGLFTLAPRPYSYTKWTPEQRPARPGHRVVYSASERTSDQQVVAWCQQGHRVAVVFNVAKSKPLPETWHGIPVVDGDKTDDLWAHPAGSIVGLRAKGTLATRDQMLASGFTKQPVPGTPIPVASPTRRPQGSPATVPVVPASPPAPVTGCPLSAGGCPMAA
jgi:hypothetical protein